MMKSADSQSGVLSVALCLSFGGAIAQRMRRLVLPLSGNVPVRSRIGPPTPPVQPGSPHLLSWLAGGNIVRTIFPCV